LSKGFRHPDPAELNCPAAGKEKARVYDYVDIQVDVLTAAAKVRKRFTLEAEKRPLSDRNWMRTIKPQKGSQMSDISSVSQPDDILRGWNDIWNLGFPLYPLISRVIKISIAETNL